MSRFPRPCLDCGALSQGNRCPEHAAQQRAKYGRSPDSQRRKTKKAFLYGGSYKRRAKHVRDTAIVCHICGQGYREGDPWEADHLNPQLGSHSPLAAAHRSCNIERGNRERNTHSNTP